MARTVVQTCVVHLMRNSFKYASNADGPALGAALKLVYHAATLSEAEQRFEDFTKDWEQKYPAISKLWERNWGEFVPFCSSTGRSAGSCAPRTPSNR